jgi:hypothetical protein
VDAALRRKLDDKAWEGIYVGTLLDSRAWLIYHPVTKRTVASRSVTFDECELLSLFHDHAHITGNLLTFSGAHGHSGDHLERAREDYETCCNIRFTFRLG